MSIYCDTHVHCYDFSEIDSLLNFAYSNAKASYFDEQEDQLVLFFTDGRDDKTWMKLTSVIQNKEHLEQWQLKFTPCDKTISAIHLQTNAQITLVAARQINSSERLEFLVLGYSGDDPDGDDAEKIIEKFANDCLLICPWGVGKWLFSRGVLLSSLLARFRSGFYLGDNGGRPWFWSYVPHFRQTKQAIFNGSDPLPIKGEISRVASYGVKININKGEYTSAARLIDLLKNESVTKENFGKPMGIFAFIKSRFALALS